ncbi:STAS domain-containing protein, partial [Streptosporangium sp. NPDC048865]|uniref:STAS domain-containing protein n=1 Tax=Streptosporangium sp. NPDC048865 TaxID=3155766 RepID=UPI003440EBDD
MDASSPFVSPSADAPAGVVVVRAEGELDGRYGPRFRGHVDAALQAPRTHAVILDLSAMPLCGALGVAELLHADRGSRHARITLLLTGVHQAVQERLNTTGLAALFTIHPTPAEAIG